MAGKTTPGRTRRRSRAKLSILETGALRRGSAVIAAVLGLATGTDARQARTGSARSDRGGISMVADPSLWSIAAPRAGETVADERADASANF
jgi:hypothetical protein